MDHYWDHLRDDGGWDEGTGYWRYGHRYALMAAEALRRSGNPAGDAVFARPGVRRTGYFPLVFNPGTRLAAGFGDSNSRAYDPIFYFLGARYRDAAFIWYQDRAPLDTERVGWPDAALALIWRPVDEPWLPENTPNYVPDLPAAAVFAGIGWALLAPTQPDPPHFLSFKNGSLAANHTHLDLNHVSVGVGDEMLLIELGNRPYPADYFRADRRYGYYEIGTRGHNTVLVGGRGQVHGRKGRLLPLIERGDIRILSGVADDAYELRRTGCEAPCVHARRRPGVPRHRSDRDDRGAADRAAVAHGRCLDDRRGRRRAGDERRRTRCDANARRQRDARDVDRVRGRLDPTGISAAGRVPTGDASPGRHGCRSWRH